MKLFLLFTLFALKSIDSWSQGFPEDYDVIVIENRLDMNFISSTFKIDKYKLLDANPGYAVFANDISNGRSETFEMKVPKGMKEKFAVNADYYYRLSKKLIELDDNENNSQFIPKDMGDSMFVALKSDITTHLYKSPIYSDSLWVDQVQPGINILGYTYNLSDSDINPSFWSVYYKGHKYYTPDFSGHFQRTKNMPFIIARGYSNDSLREWFANLIFLESEKSRINHEIDSLKKVKYQILQAIRIPTYSWNYASEYSLGANLSINIENLSKKTIKYIWITIAAKDAVGGRLTSLGRATVTVKGIGPIASNDYGSYSFENVFWSTVIDELYISSIKIQYMDNSIKLIPKPMQLVD